MKKTSLFFIPALLVLTLGSCSYQKEHEFYVVSLPNKMAFNVGEAFSLDGLVLADSQRLEYTITDYSSSISEGYVFTTYDVGEHVVSISKNNYKDFTYKITVTNLPVLEIYEYPCQEFVIGEYFSIDGLVVISDGQVISEYDVSISTANRLYNLGEFMVVISKDGYQSVSYTIHVYPQKALSIRTLPNNTSYTEGDIFDSTGLVVINEREQVVIDYTLSILNGTVLKGAGSKVVEVTKDGYTSASFTIKVNEGGGSITSRHTIDIYYLNDTHGTYQRNTNESEGGMAYISSYIKENVSKNPTYSIVLSGGDMFQGGYESNETHGQIMIDAMNEIGFDAMVIGNHEFDWGENYIRSFGDSLNCTMISSNIFYKDGTRPSWANPYVILDKGDVRIGIIGGATENMGSSIVGNVSDNFSFPNPTTYIQYYSDELRNSHGCDIVIGAFHDEGFDGYNGSPTKFDTLTTVSLNSGKKYVDAMFFAHDHYRKAGSYNDVPYLESWCNGKAVGHMSLDVEGNGISYSVTNYSTSNTYADSGCQTYDTSFEVIDEKYADIILKGNQIVYTFKNSYTEAQFAEVVCMAMYWYVNAHKEEFDNTTVTMASHNSGGIRDDVSSGAMYLKDFVKIFPFDNLLSIQICSPSNINNYKNYDYYVTYGTASFEIDGYARVASINYITEKNNTRFQVSYKNYDIIVKDILYEYLINNINPNL